MFLLIVALAVALSVFAVIAVAWPRSPAVVSLTPRPETYRNIRVLHNDPEIREVAQQAYDRERSIAYVADRRAARLRELMDARPEVAAIVVANATPPDRKKSST